MQVAIIFASAVLRWPGCAIEALRVARRVEEVSFDPPPVFIVGHWRSGTTLLHNLLSRDPGFCFPTVVDVLRPYDFYPNPLDFVTRRVVLRFLPRTRPMDDVRLDPDLPQEEELALATMGAPSFFNCIYFPKRMTSVFAQDVLFAGADDKSLSIWREALRYYLAKLSALNPGRRLPEEPGAQCADTSSAGLVPGREIHPHPSRAVGSISLDAKLLSPHAPHPRPTGLPSRGHRWPYPVGIPELMNRLLDRWPLPPGDAIVVRYDELVADPARSWDLPRGTSAISSASNMRLRLTRGSICTACRRRRPSTIKRRPD